MNPVCLRVNATNLDQDLDQNLCVNGALDVVKETGTSPRGLSMHTWDMICETIINFIDGYRIWPILVFLVPWFSSIERSCHIGFNTVKYYIGSCPLYSEYS